jgi:DHA1 family bicyclomycin/chloramphenicol resistance-like MFS transporter
VGSQLDLALLVGLMFMFSVGVGSAAPAALSQAISVNQHAIGSASGLYGFIQMAVGAALTALVGLGRNPSFSAAVVLALAGIIAQGCFWMALWLDSRERCTGYAEAPSHPEQFSLTSYELFCLRLNRLG